MGRHNDRVYVRHIIDSIDKIATYLENVSRDEFLASSLLGDAVIRNLEIIGEASNNLSSDFKESHRNINLRPAVSMRNQLAHGYDDVDLEVVWTTVKEDLPVLKEQISNI